LEKEDHECRLEAFLGSHKGREMGEKRKGMFGKKEEGKRMREEVSCPHCITLRLKCFISLGDIIIQLRGNRGTGNIQFLFISGRNNKYSLWRSRTTSNFPVSLRDNFDPASREAGQPPISPCLCVIILMQLLGK